MSANLLGALVLAATVAFVVGTVIERGSGESPAVAGRLAPPLSATRGPRAT